MTDREKTTTVHLPSKQAGGNAPANMDSVSTQVLIDKSNIQVGVLTVIEGNGRGEKRAVYTGTNQVGRSSDNRIALDFGDTTISRVQHAVIVFDAGKRKFQIFDGGKQNPILVNGERLVGDQFMADGDTIRIGMTTLRFNVI